MLGTVIGLSSGCSYITKGAYASVDAAEAYCESNTVIGRQLVRDALNPAAIEKDIAICLRCPGDTATFCSGDPKTLAQ